MTPEQELAYLGGIFDSEGSATFCGSTPRLEVNMLSPEPMEIANKYLGVPIVRQRKGNKLIYRWYAGGKSAEAAAFILMPIAPGKRDEISAVRHTKEKLARVRTGKRPPLVLHKTREEKMAYIAGLIDGDGCISISRRNMAARPKVDNRVGKAYRTKPSHILEVTLGMVDGRIPEAIKNITGLGAVSRRTILSGKTMYRWKATGDEALQFLTLIGQYLLCKKEEAEIAKAFQINKKPRTKAVEIDQEDLVFRETCLNKMKRIKYLRYNNPEVLI